MNELLVLRQSNQNNIHIEAGIARGAATLPGISVAEIDLAGFKKDPSLRHLQPEAAIREAVARLLDASLRRTEPNVLLTNGYFLEDMVPGFLLALRAAGKRVISWQIDDPYYLDRGLAVARLSDQVFTVDRAALPYYAAQGTSAEYLPLAFDPALAPARLHDPAYEADVCFIGTPFRGSRRLALMAEIVPLLAGLKTHIAGASQLDRWRDLLPGAALLADKIDDRMVNAEEMAARFAGARVNLNLHKDSFGHPWDRNSQRVVARSPNERCFVIAGCGGFQLVDDSRPDLDELFDTKSEVITFRESGDLADKIRWFLQHDHERAALAEQARRRVLACHLYQHRLERVSDLLR